MFSTLHPASLAVRFLVAVHRPVVFQFGFSKWNFASLIFVTIEPTTTGSPHGCASHQQTIANVHTDYLLLAIFSIQFGPSIYFSFQILFRGFNRSPHKQPVRGARVLFSIHFLRVLVLIKTESTCNCLCGRRRRCAVGCHVLGTRYVHQCKCIFFFDYVVSISICGRHKCCCYCRRRCCCSTK